MMNYVVALVVSAALGSCAHAPRQDVLRNQPPIHDLHKAVEILSTTGIGYGAPVHGNRIVTAAHLIHGTAIRYRIGDVVGQLEIIKEDVEHDLAVLQSLEDLDAYLSISTSMPEVGEEVYWVIRHVDGNWSFSRGWYLGEARGWSLIAGWYGPGTSGSPVLRADGTVWGIASSGYNWSCVANSNNFLDMTVEGKLNCLFRMSQFPPEMRVRSIVGEVR